MVYVRIFFLFPFSFFHPIYCLRPSILSLIVVTQIRGHIAGSSPPLPITVRALHFFFFARRSQLFPRRLAASIIIIFFFDLHFYFPAQLVGGVTLSDLLDKPRSQVSFLLPGTCLPFYRAYCRVQHSHCSSIFIECC